MHRFVMGLLQCQQKAHNITVEMPITQAIRPPAAASQRLSNGSQSGRAGETQWQSSVHPPPCSNRSMARWTFGFCAKTRPEDFSNLQIRNLLQRDHFRLRQLIERPELRQKDATVSAAKRVFLAQTEKTMRLHFVFFQQAKSLNRKKRK